MTQTRTYSLRVHLLGLISTLVILAGLLIGGIAMGFIYKEIGEVYDAQLVQTAKLLFQLTHHELAEEGEGDGDNIRLGNIDAGVSHAYEKKLAFRIWKDGELVTESASAGAFGVNPSPPGFSVEDDDGDGHFWRNFVYVDKAENITVEVAENNAVRNELIFQILSSLLLPAFLFVPMILFFVWWGTTRSLRPMTVLADQVNARGSHDLTPLEMDRTPQEITPFIEALNRLFHRVGEALHREREFTDNAAHELRTPLAAMKTQIQVLLRADIGEDDKKEGLENLHAAVNRASHMVGQLLSFARIQGLSDAASRLDLSQIGRQICEEFTHTGGGQRTLKTRITPGLEIGGNLEAVSILTRNLIDNAVKYSPKGSVVEFALSRAPDGSHIVLEVNDEGPGVPEVLREKIFERFFRVEKSQGTGSGLGLSMVRWIADRHGASITLTNRQPTGLCVRVAFPASLPGKGLLVGKGF